MLTNKHVVEKYGQPNDIKLRFFYDAVGNVGIVVEVERVRFINVGGHDFAVLEACQGSGHRSGSAEETRKSFVYVLRPCAKSVH